MKKITRSQIKWIKKLQSKTKRKQAEYFLVEGAKMVKEALLHRHINVHSIYATERWINAADKNALQAVVYLSSYDELQQLSGQNSTQQVLAVVHKKYIVPHTLSSNQWEVVLEDIQDPGNVGTIIRTCDWYGVQKVVCSLNCAHKFTAKTIQASMGSIFRIPIEYKEDIYSWITQQAKDVWVSSLQPNSIAHTEVPDTKAGILVLGNESKGVSSQLRQLATKQVYITKSKKTKAESLNVAVACGILLDNLLEKS